MRREYPPLGVEEAIAQGNPSRKSKARNDGEKEETEHEIQRPAPSRLPHRPRKAKTGTSRELPSPWSTGRCYSGRAPSKRSRPLPPGLAETGLELIDMVQAPRCRFALATPA